MGGGNAVVETENGLATGLSPRGRGKLHCETRRLRGNRSIPAWAGETWQWFIGLVVAEVYPRVGGGNSVSFRLTFRVMGLSPRGRGKRQVLSTVGVGVGSIPAWAGETVRGDTPRRIIPVYPRVGGGNCVKGLGGGFPKGLSPRGRGKQTLAGTAIRGARSIPAWAGETPRACPASTWQWVYPRVGGGNSPSSGACAGRRPLSPRGRGKQTLAGTAIRGARSIPAWAGETPRACPASTWQWVYPRVGGGNDTQWWRHWYDGGLSPRGRGKLPRFTGCVV